MYSPTRKANRSLPVSRPRRTIVVAAYTAAHVELLLETAGFGDVQMLDNWTDAPVSPDTANITFVARKPP